jgi:hypothetical protein
MTDPRAPGPADISLDIVSHSPPASTPTAEGRAAEHAARRARAMDALRKMSPAAYIGMATAEGFATGAVLAPLLMVYYGLEGVIAARFPRVSPGAAPPAIPL